MSEIDKIIDVVLALPAHLNDSVVATAANAAKTSEISVWERNHGLLLPTDYKLFLSRVGECQLHGVLTFLPLRNIRPLTELIYGNDPNAPVLPQSWYAFAILGDSDYSVMDLTTVAEDSVDIIDGFHEEAHSSLEIIAKSFTEFLKRSIDDDSVSTGGGGGHGYWSKPGPSYGCMSNGCA